MRKRKICCIVMLIIATCKIAAQEIPIEQTFYSDTILSPFTNPGTLSYLKLNADVHFYADSSLIRVILLDENATPFLIYEGYPLISEPDVSLTDYCDETCFLDRIKPEYVKIEIYNADISINYLKYSLEEIPNVNDSIEVNKFLKDSLKISTINSKQGIYWRAGRTSISDLSFAEKHNLLGKNVNLQGIEYYKGGIFQNYGNRNFSHPSNSSVLVESFDWRYRHNAHCSTSPYWDGQADETGWITPVTDQKTCGYCSGFASIAAAETRANIYYNTHHNFNQQHLDLDLSELMLMRCMGVPCNQGTLIMNCLQYMKNNFICNEDCFPYIGPPPPNTIPNYWTTNPSCNEKCTYPPDYEIEIDNFITLNSINVDDLKIGLIQSGPVVCCIPNYILGQDHAMLLVGFETINEGDTIYHGENENDPDIIVDSISPFRNAITWWLKNSWGPDWGAGGFAQIDDISLIDDSWYKLTGGITRRVEGDLIEISHQCTDEDKDGYY